MLRTDFSRFIREKRQNRHITLSELAEKSGISTGYYSDIESGRRNPPNKETLDKMIAALNLSDEDRITFYDLAGKARSEAPPDLPDYINENEKVRVALRLAKNSGNAQVWDRFVDFLKAENEGGGARLNAPR
jgi:transcriptional regulator with XRE-family HTH domain